MLLFCLCRRIHLKSITGDSYKACVVNVILLFVGLVCSKILISSRSSVLVSDFASILIQVSLFLVFVFSPRLGLLPDTDCSAESTSYTESSSEFPRGNLLRNWAANRMLDAESYWLFRHNLASHLALIGLTEQLFHLTPTHPACLVMDPRSGRAESRHVLFNLPTWSTCPSLGSGSASEGAATNSAHLSQISSLTTCFATVMGLCSSKAASREFCRSQQCAAPPK